MTATKNNGPPSSTLVMTVLVPSTSPSRNLCTLRSSRSFLEHRAYTLRPATSENPPPRTFVNKGKRKGRNLAASALLSYPHPVEKLPAIRPWATNPSSLKRSST